MQAQTHLDVSGLASREVLPAVSGSREADGCGRTCVVKSVTRALGRFLITFVRPNLLQSGEFEVFVGGAHFSERLSWRKGCVAVVHSAVVVLSGLNLFGVRLSKYQVHFHTWKVNSSVGTSYESQIPQQGCGGNSVLYGQFPNPSSSENPVFVFTVLLVIIGPDLV